jgi:putative membrane protein insertion efficiency factor
VSGALRALGDRLALRSTRPLNPVSRVLSWPLLGLIRVYQWTLSPLLGPVCRYHPSCSRYGFGSIRDHGPLLGSWLAGRRILRCNPWARGGVDPVAPRGSGWATLVWRARAPEEPEGIVTAEGHQSPAGRPERPGSDQADPDPLDPAPSRSAAA